MPPRLQGAIYPVIIMLLITGCTPSPQRSVTPTSPLPSISPTPEATYTASVPTSTIQPTRTTSPRPTDVPLIMESPTPLATPDTGASAFHLKPWNEQAALNLFRVMEDYSYDVNIPKPWGEKRFDYQEAQAPIKLAAQEMLLRFPSTLMKGDLLWRIALANALLDNPETDEWLLDQLEKGLNSGAYDPTRLNELLNPHGFQVRQMSPAPNLFGDGRLAQVLWIATQDKGDTGLYAALAQDAPSHYQLIKIQSSWDFNFGGDEAIQSEDHTQDGQPEVVLQLGDFNGSFCSVEVFIYQWYTDHFVDVSRGRVQINDCTRGGWNYGSPDENGIVTLEVNNELSSYLDIFQLSSYHWNGHWYALADKKVNVPTVITDAYDLPDFLNFTMRPGSYQVAADQIKKVLPIWATIKEADSIGASYPDYLRFELGIVEALQSQAQQAREILQGVIEQPQNPITLTVSQAAQAYLDAYAGDVDVYRACQAALSVLGDPWKTREDSIGDLGFDAIDQPLCPVQSAFRKVISTFDATSTLDLLEYLRQAEVPILRSAQLDLNNDHLNDWIAIDQSYNIWLLLRIASNFVPFNLAEFQESDINHDIVSRCAIQAKDSLEIKMILGAIGVPPMVVLKSGECLYVFRVTRSASGSIWLSHLLSIRDVKSYLLNQNTSGINLNVTGLYNCATCTATYRWEAGNDTFSLVARQVSSLNREDALQQAAVKLLADAEPKTIIPALTDLLADRDWREQPQVHYLLGLAYELSGNEPQAVQAYLNLWRTYPESAYARMVQAKLELQSP